MPKEVYTIRIDPKVKEQIQKIAEKENRTAANLIETAILEYIKKKKIPNK